jgi:hypothetical protein
VCTNVRHAGSAMCVGIRRATRLHCCFAYHAGAGEALCFLEGRLACVAVLFRFLNMSCLLRFVALSHSTVIRQSSSTKQQIVVKHLLFSCYCPWLAAVVQVKGYSDVIKHPMDLFTMKSKVVTHTPLFMLLPMACCCPAGERLQRCHQTPHGHLHHEEQSGTRRIQ